MSALAEPVDVENEKRKAFLVGWHNGQVELLMVIRGSIGYRRDQMATETQGAMLALLDLCEQFLATCDNGRADVQLRRTGFVKTPYTRVTGARIDGEAVELPEPQLITKQRKTR